jgi:hypothetical protein
MSLPIISDRMRRRDYFEGRILARSASLSVPAEEDDTRMAAFRRAGHRAIAFAVVST